MRSLPSRADYHSSNCIVTIDAMGCQHAIATQIVEQGGDGVLGLKGNQSNLHEAVEDVFTTAHDHDCRGVAYDTHEEVDKDHGRLEVRRYWITEPLQTLSNTQQWTGLRSLGMVERECWQGNKHSIERRYFLNSIAADAQRFARASRDHWGIENQLHWRMDVVLGSDSRTRGCLYHSSRQSTCDHDNDETALPQPVRARAVQAKPCKETP